MALVTGFIAHLILIAVSEACQVGHSRVPCGSEDPAECHAHRPQPACLLGFLACLAAASASTSCCNCQTSTPAQPQSPFSIITDAAIAASTDAAGYGRKRVLASLGYGGELR